MKKEGLAIGLIGGIAGTISILGGKFLEILPPGPMYTLGGILLLMSVFSIISFIKHSLESKREVYPNELVQITAEKAEESGRKTQENEALKRELEKYQKLTKILNLLVEEGKIPVWQVYQIWENILEQKDTYLIFETGDAFPLSKALNEKSKKKIKFSKEAKDLIVSTLYEKEGFAATRSMFSNFIMNKMKAIRVFSGKYQALRMVPLYLIKIPRDIVSSEDKVKRAIVSEYLEYADRTKQALIGELEKIKDQLNGKDKESMEKLLSDIASWHPTNSVLLVIPITTMPIVLGTDKVSSKALSLLVSEDEKNLKRLTEHLKENVFPNLTASIYGKYAGLYIGKVRKLEQYENEVLDQLGISSWSELPILWEKNPTACISAFSTADLTPNEIGKFVEAIREIQNVLS